MAREYSSTKIATRGSPTSNMFRYLDVVGLYLSKSVVYSCKTDKFCLYLRPS